MNYNELYHHGILGMKWGKKKWPSLSAYSKSKSASEKNALHEKKRKSELKKASKNRRLLSDNELRSRIERFKLEKQLKDLTDEDLSPGRKFVSEVLSQSGKKVATTIISGAMLYAIKTSLTKQVDLKDLAGYIAPKPKNK